MLTTTGAGAVGGKGTPAPIPLPTITGGVPALAYFNQVVILSGTPSWTVDGKAISKATQAGSKTIGVYPSAKLAQVVAVGANDPAVVNGSGAFVQSGDVQITQAQVTGKASGSASFKLSNLIPLNRDCRFYLHGGGAGAASMSGGHGGGGGGGGGYAQVVISAAQLASDGTMIITTGGQTSGANGQSVRCKVGTVQVFSSGYGHVGSGSSTAPGGLFVVSGTITTEVNTKGGTGKAHVGDVGGDGGAGADGSLGGVGGTDGVDGGTGADPSGGGGGGGKSGRGGHGGIARVILEPI